MLHNDRSKVKAQSCPLDFYTRRQDEPWAFLGVSARGVEVSGTGFQRGVKRAVRA